MVGIETVVGPAQRVLGDVRFDSVVFFLVTYDAVVIPSLPNALPDFSCYVTF